MIHLIMVCTAYDIIAIVVSLGGLIISEILPHCPGVKANGILHFATIFLQQLGEANSQIRDEQQSKE